jgi:ATP-dependent DNA helicase RecG
MQHVARMRGAASYPVNTADQLRRLEYAKGVVSFENELVNVPKAEITDSPITKKFLDYVVPSAKAEAWLTKQRLIRDDRPIVSGLLSFSEELQAAMPKRCGVKIYR